MFGMTNDATGYLRLADATKQRYEIPEVAF
jgi:hypothetical protein